MVQTVERSSGARAAWMRLRVRPARPSFVTGEPVRGMDMPLGILLGVTALWIGIFGNLLWHRHSQFGTFGFDLAIHDQAIWLMTHHGTGFSTIRGVPVLGHHATFAYWLLAPFYWLGAGAQFIDMFQVVSLAAPAVLLYLLARDRLRNGWMAMVFGLAWLAHPSVQFLVWEAFHPDAIAVPWLIGAYFAATRKAWPWYWVCLIMAMGWKEDFALAGLMLGVVLFIWNQRRVAIATILICAAWFVLTTMVLMPALTGHGTPAGTLYGDFGTTPSEVATHALAHPIDALQRISDNNGGQYLRKVMQPFGFTSVLAPSVLLIGLPQYLINLLSVAYFVFDTIYHYVAIVLIAVALAAVEGVARFRRLWVAVAASVGWILAGLGGNWQAALVFLAVAVAATLVRPIHLRWILVGGIVLGSYVSTTRDGVSPIGNYYHEFWTKPERQQAKEGAAKLIPAGDSVSATYWFAPHFAHRKQIYEFPNPWRSVNWGLTEDAKADNPDTVKWIIVDLATLANSPQDLAIYRGLIADGEFQEIYNQSNIAVAKRVSVKPDGAIITPSTTMAP